MITTLALLASFTAFLSITGGLVWLIIAWVKKDKKLKKSGLKMLLVGGIALLISVPLCTQAVLSTL